MFEKCDINVRAVKVEVWFGVRAALGSGDFGNLILKRVLTKAEFKDDDSWDYLRNLPTPPGAFWITLVLFRNFVSFGLIWLVFNRTMVTTLLNSKILRRNLLHIWHDISVESGPRPLKLEIWLKPIHKVTQLSRNGSPTTTSRDLWLIRSCLKSYFFAPRHNRLTAKILPRTHPKFKFGWF